MKTPPAAYFPLPEVPPSPAGGGAGSLAFFGRPAPELAYSEGNFASGSPFR